MKDFDYLYHDSVIYGIRDPRTEEVRYVGKTIDFDKRKASHMIPSALQKNTPLTDWLNELLTAEILPHFFIIDSDIPNSVSLLAEKSWIDYYREQGNNLTNKVVGKASWRKFAKEL